MLDQISLNAAVALTQEMSSKGITLGVVPDTPLSLLVRKTPALGMNAEDTDFAALIAQLIDLSREEDHSDLMAEAVRLASQGVRATLDFTRNTVMPHLRSVIEAHANIMAQLGAAKMPYDIAQCYTPEIYKTQVGIEFARSFEGIMKPETQREVNFGAYEADEIIQLAKLSDDGDFNSSMVELLTANGGEGIKAVQNVLEGKATVDQVDACYSLPLAIILRNLETPKEGVSMNLTDYNSARAVAANAAGKIALLEIERLDHQIRTGNLYAKLLRSDPKLIEVTGEVYRLMLDKGLTVEMLVGNELLNRKYRANQLLDPENQAEMVAAYETDKANRQAAHQLNLRQASRTAVLDVLRNDQRQIAEAGKFTVEGDTAEKSWSRLRSIVDKIYAASPIDPEASMVIAAVICAVWYAHTDAMRYIDIMFSIEKEQPHLKKEQIASLAALRYISEFFGSMITVAGGDE